MSRISKTKAHYLANAVLEKTNLAAEDANKQDMQIIHEIYLKALPPEIVELFTLSHKSAKKFLYTSSSLKICSEKNPSDNYNYYLDIPVPGHHGGYVTIDHDSYKRIVNIIERIEARNTKIRSLANEVESIIYTLRTAKRVIEEFPQLEDKLEVDKPMSAELSRLPELKRQIIV